MFAEYRLVFQEKGKSPGHIERVGENREAEVKVEQYCHTETEINEAYKKIDAAIKSLKGYDKITVVLKGIASNKPFDSFYNTEKKKMCIDLNKTPQFKGDFDYALKVLFLRGSFDAILGSELAKQLGNSMQKNAIEGIWDLPIEAQQNIMKYAQAYLLVESMGTGLSKKFAGRKNITFRMEIERDMTEGSKSRTSINLEPKKKGAEVLSREEPRKRPEPILKPIPEQREVMKSVEYKETVGWNEGIVPTFDDGPVVREDGSVDNVTLDIMRTSYEKGVNRMEFYWIGANLLSKAVREKMGIKVKNGVPVTTDKVKPGHWREWIYANKPAGMNVQEFIKTLVNPEVTQMCQDIFKIKHQYQSLSDLIGFHGMTHEGTGSGKHLTDLTEMEIRDEMWFFEELMRVAFNDPAYTIEKARTPYGTGLEFDINDPAKKYEERGKKLREATPKVSWNAWHADTNDWKNNGDFNVEGVTDKVMEGEAKKTDKRKRVLMHEKYYADTDQPVKDMYATLTRKNSKEYLRQKQKVDLKLELGEWTKEKVNALLQEAQKIKDPNERIRFIIGKFKDKTGFLYDSQLPILEKGKLRIRLETFDCVTFIYYMVALNEARNFDEFVDNYTKLRYKDPETLGVDNDPETGNIYDFTYESIYENAVQRGMLQNITPEVAGEKYLTTVTTVLKPVERDSKHDKKKQLVTPKVHNGERVYAGVITVEDYNKIDKSKIKSGDVIVFTKGSEQRVVFTHCAFALVKNGEIYITHASTSCPKPGICDNETERFRVDNYINRVGFKGFAVLRPQNL